MADGIKVTRARKTPADELAKLDKQTLDAEAWVATLKERRAKLVAEIQAKADALLGVVKNASGS